MVHLVAELDSEPLAFVRRDQLQAVLDDKAAKGLSFSIVEHLRWDAKQIFDMAIAEGLMRATRRRSSGRRAMRSALFGVS